MKIFQIVNIAFIQLFNIGVITLGNTHILIAKSSMNFKICGMVNALIISTVPVITH